MSPLFFLVPTLMFFFTPLVQSALLLICQMLIPYIVLSFTQMQVIKQGCQPVEPKLEVQLGSNKNDFFLPSQKIQAQSEPLAQASSSRVGSHSFSFFDKKCCLAGSYNCLQKATMQQAIAYNLFFFKRLAHHGSKTAGSSLGRHPKMGLTLSLKQCRLGLFLS